MIPLDQLPVGRLVKIEVTWGPTVYIARVDGEIVHCGYHGA